MAQIVGPTVDVFLGIECDGAALTRMFGPLFSGPVARKLSLARRLSGADTAEAEGIVWSLVARPRQAHSRCAVTWAASASASPASGSMPAKLRNPWI